MADDNTVTIPKEPSLGVLMSMALRYDHALGMPGFYDQPICKVEGVTHQDRLNQALATMRQLYEEVARRGFYREEKEDYYVGMIGDQTQPPWMRGGRK